MLLLLYLAQQSPVVKSSLLDYKSSKQQITFVISTIKMISCLIYEMQRTSKGECSDF